MPIARFTSKLPTERMAPADGPATLCGLFVETDDRDRAGAARAANSREGGVLAPELPERSDRALRRDSLMRRELSETLGR